MDVQMMLLEIMQSLSRVDKTRHFFWSDGNRIYCETELQRNILADFLNTVSIGMGRQFLVHVDESGEVNPKSGAPYYTIEFEMIKN